MTGGSWKTRDMKPRGLQKRSKKMAKKNSKSEIRYMMKYVREVMRDMEVSLKEDDFERVSQLSYEIGATMMGVNYRLQEQI
jgi:hypothetical protein